MRYFLEFNYRGTAYNGWQRQNNALGVQEVLEDALAKLLRAKVELTGSSRTDAGVHARQQFAHFDTGAPIENTDLFAYKLNSLVPRDIAVLQILPVPDDTHSRFAATHRKYEYHITRVKDPFLFGLSWQLHGALNITLMNEAAQKLLIHNDFECFSKVHTNVNNFRCNIMEAMWVEEGSRLIFHIKANRFLRGMVRAIVGTMIEVGREKRSVSDFETLILSKNRKKAGAQAPAEGLFLTEVGYPDSLFNNSLFNIS